MSITADFAKGLVSVQDEAQAVSRAAGLPPGDRVLDACAAPVVKPVSAGKPKISTLPPSIWKRTLVRVRENLERLRATVIQGDASKPDEWWDGRQFDRILLDAPCSATGVIRRHPDIKLLRRRKISTSWSLGDILDAMWKLLKPAHGVRNLFHFAGERKQVEPPFPEP